MAQALGHLKGYEAKSCRKRAFTRMREFHFSPWGVGVEHGRETVLKSSFEGTYGSGKEWRAFRSGAKEGAWGPLSNQVKTGSLRSYRMRAAHSLRSLSASLPIRCDYGRGSHHEPSLLGPQCKITVMGRRGEELCDSQVVGMRRPREYDNTAVISFLVPKQYAMRARHLKVKPSDSQK